MPPRRLQRIARTRLLGRSPVGAWLRLNERIWESLPPWLIASRPLGRYGHLVHALVLLESSRQQYLGTFFLRNRPQLELLCRLSDPRRRGDELKVAVMGCSNGAEVYSIKWAVHSAFPALKVTMHAVDISPEVVEFARRGVYSLGFSELVQERICDRITEEEMQGIFERQGSQLTVRPWIKEGIEWHVADAGDPRIIDALGTQDVVFADNFLCHMEPAAAEKCLGNIGGLVKPGGYLFVSGIDLDVRTRVANDRGWKAVPDLMEDVHDGDRSLRLAWPFKYWGLEPFDARRPDGKTRYASVFQVGAGG